MAQKRKFAEKKWATTTGLGLAIWMLAAIVLVGLFIFNQNKIIANLKQTGFFNRVFGKTPAFVENADVGILGSTEKNNVEPMAPVEITLTENASQSAQSVTAQNDAARRQQEAAAGQNEWMHQQSDSDIAGIYTQPAGETSGTFAAPGQTITVKLFFMEIASDGSVIRHAVNRSMKKSESPLVDTIKALIAGPTASEENEGCRSLLSTGSSLLSASVRNGVATLNFSGEFEFNQYGIEGLRGQLQQIVFTATAFPTVESVQFLIDGERKDYLGSEGVWIGTPLNRNSF